MVELQPIADRIVIEPLDDETVTPGGILLTATASSRDATQRARVIAVGAGMVLSSGVRILPEVAVGDIILFNRMAGIDIKVGLKIFKITTERDIIGIIRE